jgi:hypothetical protein
MKYHRIVTQELCIILIESPAHRHSSESIVEDIIMPGRVTLDLDHYHSFGYHDAVP